ncbi:WD repeat-containing protein 74-like [Tropilaelaps mercedesae]|uniref:WD repeat-containing protein 74-like n=1 Tax=Tropilaelaps mercedesae TaxID=418985 RepID=A0A1V9WYN1_9ACAR|nr:WD repeat-containing protein 74-like [Tropilaelaps mercedesae]
MNAGASAMFHVYCGAETGFLKGVNTAKKTFLNINRSADLNRNHEITALLWANSEETRIHCALRKQVVKTYDAQTGLLLSTVQVQAGEGPIKGLEVIGDALVTCSRSGAFRVWRPSQESPNEHTPQLELDVGPDVFRMRRNPLSEQIFATGGKENELKLWDLNGLGKPAFTAKNVRNDHLDLRVPVWVTDFRFWEDSKIVVGTGYNKIRVYDTKCGQRRPVLEMLFDGYPITCLSLAGERNPQGVIVGNTHGRVALFDIRKQGYLHCFKGFAGSVRAIEVHPSKPYVVSCSLDRFLRVHDFERHVLLSKIYLKSRLSSLLLRTVGGKHSIRLEDEGEEKRRLEKGRGLAENPGEGQHDDEVHREDGNDSDDQLWDNMGLMKEEAESGIETEDEVDESASSHERERKRQRKRRSERISSSGKKIRAADS